MTLSSNELSAAEAAELSEEDWEHWAAMHPDQESEVLISRQTVSYTHLTLPTNREV